MRATGGSPQKPGVVGDLCSRGYRAPGTGSAGRSLLDGKHGGQTLDIVDVGTTDFFESLTGLRGEALDVLPVAFCRQDVEDKGGFTGATDPSDADQLPSRELGQDTLEVVLPGALDQNLARFQLTLSFFLNHGKLA